MDNNQQRTSVRVARAKCGPNCGTYIFYLLLSPSPSLPSPSLSLRQGLSQYLALYLYWSLVRILLYILSQALLFTFF